VLQLILAQDFTAQRMVISKAYIDADVQFGECIAQLLNLVGLSLGTWPYLVSEVMH
jgi:hypothetical protein